jgi:hypothetical protein
LTPTSHFQISRSTAQLPRTIRLIYRRTSAPFPTEILLKRFPHFSLVFPRFLVQLFQSASARRSASREGQPQPASACINHQGESMRKLNGTKIHAVMRVSCANLPVHLRDFFHSRKIFNFLRETRDIARAPMRNLNKHQQPSPLASAQCPVPIGIVELSQPSAPPLCYNAGHEAAFFNPRCALAGDRRGVDRGLVIRSPTVNTLQDSAGRI